MKIMMVASWYPSEDNPLNGCFFQERARAWARLGCDVSVAVADVRLRLGNRKEGISFCQEQGVKEYRFLKRNLTPFWEEGIARQQISMIRKIYDQICRESGKPDLIHLESARCAFAAVELSRKENIPLTYTEHYSGILNSKTGSFCYTTMRRAVDAAEHIFLISSAMRNKLNPPDGKWSMLPNTVDFSNYSVSEPEGPFTFCTMGGLRKIKGYDLLLHAFAQVHEEFPDCRLVIGGKGEEREALTALCEELSIANYVQFYGAVEKNDKNRFFKGKAAFVSSSRTETFAIVVVEAFACGIPVVATRCGGPEDLVNESNGYLVEKESVTALVEGMKKMITNRHQFCPQKIRNDAYALYSEELQVKKQLEMFAQIIAKKTTEET